MENEADSSGIHLLFKEEIGYTVAAGYYSSDEKAKKHRKSAVLLIEWLWEICKSEGCNDVTIPYFAVNLYDRFSTSAEGRNNKDLDDELLVMCCLTIALKVARGKTFLLSEFLTNYKCRYDIEQIKSMQGDILCGLNSTIEAMKILTPICFTKYFIEKLLQPSQPHHIQRTHRLVCELIVKSQADIAMTAFKPSIVAASAVLAILSKLFLLKTYNMRTIMLDDEIFHNDKADAEECLAKIINWCDGLACEQVETVRSLPIEIPKSNTTRHTPPVNKPDDDVMFMLGESSEKSTDTDDVMSEEASEKSTDDLIAGQMSGVGEENSLSPKKKKMKMKKTIIHGNNELKNGDADKTMTTNIRLCWTDVVGERDEPSVNQGWLSILLKATVSCLGVNEKDCSLESFILTCEAMNKLNSYLDSMENKLKSLIKPSELDSSATFIEMNMQSTRWIKMIFMLSMEATADDVDSSFWGVAKKWKHFLEKKIDKATRLKKPKKPLDKEAERCLKSLPNLEAVKVEVDFLLKRGGELHFLVLQAVISRLAQQTWVQEIPPNQEVEDGGEVSEAQQTESEVSVVPQQGGSGAGGKEVPRATSYLDILKKGSTSSQAKGGIKRQALDPEEYQAIKSTIPMANAIFGAMRNVRNIKIEDDNAYWTSISSREAKFDVTYMTKQKKHVKCTIYVDSENIGITLPENPLEPDIKSHEEKHCYSTMVWPYPSLKNTKKGSFILYFSGKNYPSKRAWLLGEYCSFENDYFPSEFKAGNQDNMFIILATVIKYQILCLNSRRPNLERRYAAWMCPKEPLLSACSDASHVNPSLGGFTGILRNSRGDFIKGVYGAGFAVSAFIAEIISLTLTVKMCADLNPHQEYVLLIDCQDIIDTLNNKRKPADEAEKAAIKVLKDALKRLTNYKLVHIIRAGNGPCDEGATYGRKKAFDTYDHYCEETRAHYSYFAEKSPMFRLLSITLLKDLIGSKNLPTEG